MCANAGFETVWRDAAARLAGLRGRSCIFDFRIGGLGGSTACWLISDVAANLNRLPKYREPGPGTDLPPDKICRREAQFRGEPVATRTPILSPPSHPRPGELFAYARGGRRPERAGAVGVGSPCLQQRAWMVCVGRGMGSAESL
jgi:hypothetical protein